MENEGWIKLHRQFLEWEWFDSDEMVRLFLAILLMANHEDKKWHGITIRRGQILTSRDKLAEVTGLSAQQVRTCLSRFEKTGEITKKSTNKNTLITVSNYDRYQVREGCQQPTTNQQSTSNQPTINQQSTTNKNDKNEENISISHSIEEQPAENFWGRWRCLSSVQRSVCGFDKDKMAEMKRDIFRQEVEAIALQIGMPAEQVDDFVRYYAEHTPGDDRIRAESYDIFNVKDRMIGWMKRERPKGGAARPTQRPKSKVEQTIESRNEFQQWVNEQFGNTEAGFGVPAAPGYSDADYQSGE